jgi:peptidoglycan hydrolase-like protein with peptidoglycan-binding domain
MAQHQSYVGLTVTMVRDQQTPAVRYSTSAAPASSNGARLTDPRGLRADGGRRPAAVVVSTRTTYSPYKDVVVGVGARGGMVRFLQRALGGVAVDGVFGAVTERAVMGLQRSQAMPVTGVVTPDLWDVLERRDFPFIGERATVLRPGDNGPAVTRVQRILGVPTTGWFDAATRDAVKQAQARAGLASTGIIASRTWSLLDQLSA